MKKQSIYNIWVEEGDIHILYNSFSDRNIIFRKDEVENIKYYLDHTSEFEEVYPDLFRKIERLGFICDSSFDELNALIYHNRKEVFGNKDYRLTINPTLQCNYKCWYCCVEEVETKYEPRRMNDATIRKVKKHIQYMLEKERISMLTLDWFGGEPLMYFNEVILPISKYSLKLSTESNVPFTNGITTNAYFIDNKIIEKMVKIKMTSFQIPIDGSETKHNSVKNMEGKGHYKRIIGNVNSICEKIENASVVLRINYDKNTLRTISDVIDDIRPENRKNIFVDFQRVWQVPLSVDENGNNQILLKAIQNFEDAGFRTLNFLYKRKNNKCCYADSYYHRVINYDGKIFKCTARDYSDELSIGSIGKNGELLLNDNLLSVMFSDIPFRNNKCLNCKMLPICYGPCVQKYYDEQIGKGIFQCRYDYSEVSFQNYIIRKATNELEILKQQNKIKS
ncbi:MAG: radical SAM protein [Candidatus Limimorpha sp.]